MDAATGLYYYGYRWHEPETGRWISRDPIEEEGGLNLYGFGRNSPVFGYDDLGNKFVVKDSKSVTALRSKASKATGGEKVRLANELKRIDQTAKLVTDALNKIRSSIDYQAGSPFQELDTEAVDHKIEIMRTSDPTRAAYDPRSGVVQIPSTGSNDYFEIEVFSPCFCSDGTELKRKGKRVGIKSLVKMQLDELIIHETRHQYDFHRGNIRLDANGNELPPEDKLFDHKRWSSKQSEMLAVMTENTYRHSLGKGYERLGHSFEGNYDEYEFVTKCP